MNIKNKLIFTICARNYYGLAKVLMRSIRHRHPEINFLMFIADGIPNEESDEFGGDAIDANIVMRNYISIEKLQEMAFKYNLTEYCTAIKPFCFRHVFDQTDVDDVVYLDPDIFVFGDLEPLFEPLNRASIVLTPHILFPSLYEGKRADKGLLATGVFNLGCLALKRGPTASILLEWWAKRLLNQCFIDGHEALFTDQKWMDFVPTLFPNQEVVCLRHPGMNVAPWNFHEREISIIGNDFWVGRRYSADSSLDLQGVDSHSAPLVFVHFSGFDYKKFCEGQVEQYNIDGLSLYLDLTPIIETYMKSIQDQRSTVIQFLKKPYTYGFFADGTVILSFYRRLYRAAIESGIVIGNPFSDEPGSFLRILRSRSLILKMDGGGIDKANKFNLSGIDSKLPLFNFLMRVLKRSIGLKNYLLLLRLMRPYSRIESQLHLIDNRHNKL